MDEVELQQAYGNYPPLITTKQAAEILQRPIATLYDWSSRGYLDEIKVKTGREVRLDRRGLISLMVRGITSTKPT